MRILVLNGSPRPNGNTVHMIKAFREGAISSGHQVDVIDVCKKKVGGCIACEHCHTEGKGECIQKDDMQEIYELLKKAEMLVLASPIYYHGMSGQLKCVIDRFYAVAYPVKPTGLKKVAIILSSGNADMYDGALFSLKEIFWTFSDLKTWGYLRHTEKRTDRMQKLAELRRFGESLKDA